MPPCSVYKLHTDIIAIPVTTKIINVLICILGVFTQFEIEHIINEQLLLRLYSDSICTIEKAYTNKQIHQLLNTYIL